MDVNDLPFPVFGLSQFEIEAFLDTYEALRMKYPATFDDTVNTDLAPFESIRTFKEFSVREFIRLGPQHFLCYCEVGYEIKTRTITVLHKEYRAYALATLNDDFGHVFIKPEGVAEKIREFFVPMETDIKEDPHFSRKFYVLAKDPVRAQMALKAPFRKALLEAGFEDFELEIHKNLLLVSSEKYLNPDDALKLAGFVATVAMNR